MLSDQQIKEDLERLKDIALATKAVGSEYETHTENVMGTELDVFSNIPRLSAPTTHSPME